MFIIKTIKLSLTPEARIKSIPLVRVGYDQYICTNKKPGRILNAQSQSHRPSQQARNTLETLQWKQDMTLPIIYKKQIEFEFYPAHEFGYNPEEINQVCHARVAIENYRKGCGEEAVVGEDGEEVGRVYFQFSLVNQKKAKYGLKGEVHEEPEIRVSVSSMLAHFELYQGEKGYFEIVLAGQSTMTPQIKFIAGQLLWAQKLALPIQSELPDTKQLSIRIFIDDELVGQGLITVKDIKSSKERFKKLPIIDVKSQEKCGMLFVDIHYKEVRGNTKTKAKGKQREKEMGNEKLKIPIMNRDSNSKSSNYLPELGNRSNRQTNLNSQNKSLKSSNSQRKLNTPSDLTSETQSSKLRGQLNPLLEMKLRMGRDRDRSETVLSKYLKYYK